jgi:cellulose 1,4-beta-cellobiosidase
MDIWEANKISEAYTAHPCTHSDGPYRCEGVECGDIDKSQRFQGVCDKDGCDFNAYRLGDKSYYGEGKTIDTTKPITVITQFHTSDGTDTGDLSEIRRVWMQDGKVVENAKISVGGKSFDSITDEFCDAAKTSFGDVKDFEKKGGLKAMGEAMDRGMVLVMSLWDDHAVNMLWLDSSFPLNESPTKPGVARGSCSTTSGKPDDVEKNNPTSSVTFSDIKSGPIGSTYPSGPAPPTPTPPTPTPPAPSGCPGGSLSACIGLCPSDPPVVYSTCVKSCAKRCAGAEVEPLV